MDVLQQLDTAIDADVSAERQRRAETVVLWAALEADHRARDERTARLRLMRLVGGEDETA